MKKLNWSCTTCGMSSGRKYSVQRHIENYNIHNGSGEVIPFVEYAVGRREGKYPPHQVPQTRSKSPFLDRIYVKIAEQVENQIVKDIANRIYEDLSADQTPFNNLKLLAEAYIIKTNYYRFFKESMS